MGLPGATSSQPRFRFWGPFGAQSLESPYRLFAKVAPLASGTEAGGAQHHYTCNIQLLLEMRTWWMSLTF